MCRTCGGGLGDASRALVTDQVGGNTAYALRVADACVDAGRFERDVACGLGALSGGALERASEVLRAAVALWRGAPLADAERLAFARDEIGRLEGLYRAARIGRAQADVGRGLYGAVVGEVEDMARQWPDDRAVQVLLITSLYRASAGEAAQPPRRYRGRVRERA